MVELQLSMIAIDKNGKYRNGIILYFAILRLPSAQLLQQRFLEKEWNPDYNPSSSAGAPPKQALPATSQKGMESGLQPFSNRESILIGKYSTETRRKICS